MVSGIVSGENNSDKGADNTRQRMVSPKPKSVPLTIIYIKENDDEDYTDEEEDSLAVEEPGGGFLAPVANPYDLVNKIEEANRLLFSTPALTRNHPVVVTIREEYNEYFTYDKNIYHSDHSLANENTQLNTNSTCSSMSYLNSREEARATLASHHRYIPPRPPTPYRDLSQATEQDHHRAASNEVPQTSSNEYEQQEFDKKEYSCCIS